MITLLKNPKVYSRWVHGPLGTEAKGHQVEGLALQLAFMGFRVLEF